MVEIQKAGQARSEVIRPDPLHRLIFTYDELMRNASIRRYCPNPKFICVAAYSSHRFIVTSEGVASIQPRRNSVVYGVVWQLHEIALAALDLSKYRPGVNERFGAFVRDLSGRLVISEHYASGRSWAWQRPHT
jgi:hypothetical protein